MAVSRGRRRNDQPHRCRRRLGLRRLSQQEDRPPRSLRAPVQAARGGEVELLRIAADFEDNGRKTLQVGSLLGNPQRVHELGCLGDKKLLRLDAEAGAQARRIGPACLAKNLGRTDPQQRRPACRPRQKPPGQRHGKSACRSGIARFRAMDFRQCGKWQAAAEGSVEGRSTGCKTELGHSRYAMAPQHDGAIVRARLDGSRQAFRQRALDLRYFPAQGKNSCLRRGGARHDDVLSDMFLLCSYRFQSATQESSISGGEFIPVPKC